jgi:hypothetical protein
MLKSKKDPNSDLNIVDLGLVYHCQVTPLPKATTKLMLIHADGTRLRHGRGATSRYGSKIRKAFIICQPGRASFIASSILRMISGQHCLATSMRA